MKEQEYLDAIEALIPRIEERARTTEELRRIPDETIDELRGAGLMKALQPARYGGFELDPVVLYRAARRIGEACGSTAWVFGILGVHPWQHPGQTPRLHALSGLRGLRRKMRRGRPQALRGIRPFIAACHGGHLITDT